LRQGHQHCQAHSAHSCQLQDSRGHKGGTAGGSVSTEGVQRCIKVINTVRHLQHVAVSCRVIAGQHARGGGLGKTWFGGDAEKEFVGRMVVCMENRSCMLLGKQSGTLFGEGMHCSDHKRAGHVSCAPGAGCVRSIVIFLCMYTSSRIVLLRRRDALQWPSMLNTWEPPSCKV
jgi:hypothetical protein